MENKNLAFTAFIKDGGYKNFVIPSYLFIQLAIDIQEMGSQQLHTANDSYWISGVLLYSKDAGERVVVIGDKN